MGRSAAVWAIDFIGFSLAIWTNPGRFADVLDDSAAMGTNFRLRSDVSLAKGAFLIRAMIRVDASSLKLI